MIKSIWLFLRIVWRKSDLSNKYRLTVSEAWEIAKCVHLPINWRITPILYAVLILIFGLGWAYSNYMAVVVFGPKATLFVVWANMSIGLLMGLSVVKIERMVNNGI